MCTEFPVPSVNMKYYSVNDYCKDTFGCKVYKVAIDGGFTCPNRDGSLDTRGCIFCSTQGSGNFAGNCSDSVTKQINEGIDKISSKLPKNKTVKYIAYFQAFTNTYAPVEVLKAKFTEAINHEKVVCLSIATRPDCLPDDVISLLKELSKIKPVWVELGLQTIHEKTAAYIRRGYALPVYDSAVDKLNAAGINVITHVIIGLPGESKEDMVETCRYVGTKGSWGIKLQLLHVLKNTDLAKDYAVGLFSALTLDEYVDIVKACMAVLPAETVIHRITGDGDKKELIAPLWSGDKKMVLNRFKKEFENN